MRGKKVNGELRFEKPHVFTLNGVTLKHPHRTLVAVLDWNGDGKMDFIGSNIEHNSATVYFGDGSGDLKGREILRQTDGGVVSCQMNKARDGRTGICAVDWDGDGYLDLLIDQHGMGMWFHRNAGDNRFEPPSQEENKPASA